MAAYEEIGKIADSVKPLTFMGKASVTYEETEKNYRKNVALGLMTEASKKKNLERLKKRLKASIETAEIDQSKKEKEERKERLKALVKGRYGFWVDKHGKVRKS